MRGDTSNKENCPDGHVFCVWQVEDRRGRAEHEKHVDWGMFFVFSG